MTQKDRWDELLYPGTATLRNLQGISDEGSWQQAEAALSATRAVLLPAFGFDGTVREQLCQTHHHLFQDCYEWAGQLRPFDMSIPVASNPGETHTFADYTTIESRLAELDEAVASLEEASYEDKVETLAYLHSELNEIHPFREGNGRTTRALMEAIAVRHDVTVTWEGHIDELHKASVESMSAGSLNFRPFHDLYRSICEEATFDDSADLSVFDILETTEQYKGAVDPLAFAHDAFPHGLQAALSSEPGSVPSQSGAASADLTVSEQYEPEQ